MRLPPANPATAIGLAAAATLVVFWLLWTPTGAAALLYTSALAYPVAGLVAGSICSYFSRPRSRRMQFALAGLAFLLGWVAATLVQFYRFRDCGELECLIPVAQAGMILLNAPLLLLGLLAGAWWGEHLRPISGVGFKPLARPSTAHRNVAVSMGVLLLLQLWVAGADLRESLFFFPSLREIFWLFVGVGASLISFAAAFRFHQATSRQPGGPPTFDRRRNTLYGIAAFAAFAALFAWQFANRPDSYVCQSAGECDQSRFLAAEEFPSFLRISALLMVGVVFFLFARTMQTFGLKRRPIGEYVFAVGIAFLAIAGAAWTFIPPRDGFECANPGECQMFEDHEDVRERALWSFRIAVWTGGVLVVAGGSLLGNWWVGNRARLT